MVEARQGQTAANTASMLSWCLVLHCRWLQCADSVMQTFFRHRVCRLPEHCLLAPFACSHSLAGAAETILDVQFALLA